MTLQPAGQSPTPGRLTSSTLPRPRHCRDDPGQQPGKLVARVCPASPRGLARRHADRPRLPLLPLRHRRGHVLFLRGTGVAGRFIAQAVGPRREARAHPLRARPLHGRVSRLDFAPLRFVVGARRIAMVTWSRGRRSRSLRRAVFTRCWSSWRRTGPAGLGARPRLPAPGGPSPSANLRRYLTASFSAPQWSGGGGIYDPEGLLSPCRPCEHPGGTLRGDYLRARTRAGGGDTERPPPPPPAARVLGGAAVLAGHAWDLVFPQQADLTSRTCLTTGWALLDPWALYWIIDVRGGAAGPPLVVYGVNAPVFVASGLVAQDAGLCACERAGRHHLGVHPSTTLSSPLGRSPLRLLAFATRRSSWWA